MNEIERVTNRAAEIFALSHPKAQYGLEVIRGRQAWSGADLRGRAKKWGSSYKAQRAKAERSLRLAGGGLMYAGRGGRVVAAVLVGTDDFGNALYQTQIGPAVAGPGKRLRLVHDFGTTASAGANQ